MSAPVFEFRSFGSNLDLNLCLFSGQSFRWRKLSDGSIEGVDGDHWAVIDASSSWQSNSPEATWQRFFQLDRTDIEQRLNKIDERFAAMLEPLKGLRLLRPSNPVEVVFSFLCSSNNHLARITQMIDYFGILGDNFAGCHLKRFPNIDRLAELSELELRSKGFGYRGKTIPIVAQRIAEERNDFFDNLKRGAYFDAHKELMTLPGIGPKVADCICLYGLHFEEAVPIDTHFLQAYERLYPCAERAASLTGRRYRVIGDAMRDRFGELAGYAQLIMYFDNMRRSRAARKP